MHARRLGVCCTLGARRRGWVAPTSGLACVDRAWSQRHFVGVAGLEPETSTVSWLQRSGAKCSYTFAPIADGAQVDGATPPLAAVYQSRAKIATNATPIATSNTTGHAGPLVHGALLPQSCLAAKKTTPGPIKTTGHSNVPSTFSVCDHVADLHNRTRAMIHPINGRKSVPTVSHKRV
jgi:hypothetical protein